MPGGSRIQLPRQNHRLLLFDHAFLGRVANRTINGARGVNLVTYDIMSQPPGRLSRNEQRWALQKALIGLREEAFRRWQ